MKKIKLNPCSFCGTEVFIAEGFDFSCDPLAINKAVDIWNRRTIDEQKS